MNSLSDGVAYRHMRLCMAFGVFVIELSSPFMNCLQLNTTDQLAECIFL